MFRGLRALVSPTRDTRPQEEDPAPGRAVGYSRWIIGKDEEVKPLIEYLVKALVDEPEHVRVEEVIHEGTITYQVHVSPGDQGKVIGKEGRIANALRVIVKSVAMKYKQKVYVEIAATPTAASAPAPTEDSPEDGVAGH